MNGSKQTSKSDLQVVSYDDLQEDQRPLLCPYEERDLIVRLRDGCECRLRWRRL